MKDKKVLVITTRGGNYPAGTLEGYFFEHRKLELKIPSMTAWGESQAAECLIP